MSTYPRTPSPTNMKHSSPIPIAGGHHGRSRSDSSATGYSSSSSDGSPPLRTPPRPTLNMTMPHVAAPPSAGTSPTSPLFTFLRAGAAQSPPTGKTAPIAYPFTSGTTRGPLSALDDEDASAPEHAAARHARRASLAGTLPARFPASTQAAASGGASAVMQTERGAGVLRRLSLGGAFGRPQVPVKPPTPPARTTTPPGLSSSPASIAPEPTRVPRTKRRSATLGVDAQRPPRRAPSPMGERILKGQFDSFH